MITPASSRWSAPAAVLAVAAATALGFFVHRYLQLADLTVLYMCCITGVATRFDRRAAFLASVLSVACLDFFFIAPRYTLTVHDLRYLGTFAMMLGVGWLVANLAERIRAQAREAGERERHTDALYRLGDLLAEGGEVPALQARVEAFLAREPGLPVLVLLPGPKGVLQPRSLPGATLHADEWGVAQWAMENHRPAGAGTGTLPGSRALFLPLGGEEHPMGVFAVFPGPDPLPQATRDLLEAMAAQLAVALERARLAAERSEARFRAEQEHLRSILLSTISHDLRTPLGTITGATSALLEPGPEATPEDQRQLLLSVRQEAERLEKLVRNLLDLTRLESGQMQVNKDWVPLEEVVGSALNRLEAQLGDREVAIHVPAAMVPLDPVLMEQVLVNLLDNALKFSPAGTPLALEGRVDPGRAELSVTDQGPGLDPGEEERIFEKLYRGGRSASAPGAGLGLAICRGIIQAHGGAIRAERAPAGGARVIITLPVVGEPPDLPAEPGTP